MEKNRKELKSFSFLVLVLVAMELIRAIITLCITGVPNASEIPGGATENLARVAYIITFVLVFIVAIPEIYIGIKGIKIAKRIQDETGTKIKPFKAAVMKDSEIASIKKNVISFASKFPLPGCDI